MTDAMSLRVLHESKAGGLWVLNGTRFCLGVWCPYFSGSLRRSGYLWLFGVPTVFGVPMPFLGSLRFWGSLWLFGVPTVFGVPKVSGVPSASRVPRCLSSLRRSGVPGVQGPVVFGIGIQVSILGPVRQMLCRPLEATWLPCLCLARAPNVDGRGQDCTFANPQALGGMCVVDPGYL
eukprot:jgi/Botrbrau1/20657/Bobra.0703s0002.1